MCVLAVIQVRSMLVCASPQIAHYVRATQDVRARRQHLREKPNHARTRLDSLSRRQFVRHERERSLPPHENLFSLQLILRVTCGWVHTSGLSYARTQNHPPHSFTSLPNTHTDTNTHTPTHPHIILSRTGAHAHPRNVVCAESPCSRGL